MCTFVGREHEIEVANRLLRHESSRIMVISGQRRIGKTALAEKIAEGYRFLRFSGISPQEAKVKKENQITHFLKELSKQTGNVYDSCTDWDDALGFLEKEIPNNEKTVILFDEISWMAQGDALFVGKLKSWWDLYISHGKNVLLIFCGSISTWIEKNIINSTAFYGRISAFINLKPLSIPDSVKLLRLRNFQRSSYEFYTILSILGGVPWYLEQIDPLRSAEQNIKDLCFSDTGLLRYEFEYIFNDVFSRYRDVYHRILDVLRQGAKNLSEIRNAINYTSGGKLSNLMDNLVVAGFVSRHDQWNLKNCSLKKQSLYRISDPYTKFYLRYIKPLGDSLKETKSFDSMVGLQIETLLLQNRKLILDLLHIDNVLRDGPYLQRAAKDRRGCQIDYLIQTDTNSLFLCEFKSNRSTMGKEVIDEVKQKINRLVLPRGKGIVPVLFYMGEVSEEVINSRFFYDLINLDNFIYKRQ